MPDANTIHGWAPLEALARILNLRGRNISLQELRESYPENLDASTLAQAIEVQGLAARAVKIRPADLDQLELPTLIQMKKGDWTVLVGHGKGYWTVDGAHGPNRIPSDALLDHLDGWAIEVGDHFSEDCGFWRRVLILIGRHRRTLARVGIAALCMQAMALLPPQLTRLIFDRALPQRAPSLLAILAIAAVLVAGFQAWVGWLRERILLSLETRLDLDLERDFLGHLLRLPFPALNSKTLGELLQGFSGLSAAREVVTGSALGAILDGATAASYLVVLVIMMPGPAILVFIVATLMAVLTLAVGLLQMRQQRLEVRARAEEQGFLSEILNGVATIKAAGAEERGLLRWLDLLSKEYRLGLRRMRVGLWPEVGLDALRQSVNAAILVWGGYAVLQSRVGLGSLMAFVQMSSAFLTASMNLANAYLAFVVLHPQLAPAVEVLEIEPSSRALPSSALPLRGPVLLEGVWFRYESKGPWVVKDRDLKVEPGEVYHLQGPSGCGKSTLLRLIAGLYTPDQGSISIGGQAPPAASGSYIYLPQVVQLFGGSILDNLSLLSGHATVDQLLETAEQTGLQELLDRLPMGLNTILPPGGGNFSGGQRQLIALTAVLASRRPLLLLDEAMSNLDWLSQKRINQSAEFAGKTIIYTSHEHTLRRTQRISVA